MSDSLPFSAVVGQDEVKLALLLCAVEPRIGGVLLRGDKGSAKTTLARGLASLLGERAPFVELPVGASEDRLVGTLDLAAVLAGGERRFEPGLLAAAHGGVLYVDEINLLPDHLVDVLLDVAASGVNRVEREGVSHVHDSRFVLIGSMNPEEGDLRPQLLDRFGLAVDVRGATDPVERALAVRRRLAWDAATPDARRTAPTGEGSRDTGGGPRDTGGWVEADAALAARLAGARPARLDDGIVDAVASLCAAVGAEGLRADLTICRAAAALAGWEARAETEADDVRRVAALALGHRARRHPLDPVGIDPERLDDALDDALPDPPARDGRDRTGATGRPDDGDGDGGSPPDGGARKGSAPDDGHDATDPGGQRVDGRGAPEDGTGDPAEGGRRSPGGAAGRAETAPIGESTAWYLESEPPGGPARPGGVAASGGRRSTAPGSRGRLVGDRIPEGPPGSLAVTATVRAAAARRAEEGPGAATVTAADLREAVRAQPRASLVVVVVDASGSMGASARMAAAKRAVLGLLMDAYQRRDLVALVAFRGDGAETLLRPTGSIEVARARLAELSTGGTTPLAAGLRRGLEVASAANRSSTHSPLLIVVTDGRATSAPGGTDPVAASDAAAAEVRRSGVASVVVDVETGRTRLGLAARLARTMGARHVPLPGDAPEVLAETLVAVASATA